MKYENITEGRFLDRPNRFIAHVEIGGQIETVHVKNTGRCRGASGPRGAGLFGKERQPGEKDSLRSGLRQ